MLLKDPCNIWEYIQHRSRSRMIICPVLPHKIPDYATNFNYSAFIFTPSLKKELQSMVYPCSTYMTKFSVVGEEGCVPWQRMHQKHWWYFGDLSLRISPIHFHHFNCGMVSCHFEVSFIVVTISKIIQNTKLATGDIISDSKTGERLWGISAQENKWKKDWKHKSPN